MKSAREYAADILCEVDKGAPGGEVYNRLMAAGTLSESDRAFVKLLYTTVLEHLTEIDAVIEAYSGRPVSSQRPLVRGVLRTGICQLRFMPDIPASAVCNEAVKILERRRLLGLKGFVNALLRRAAADTPTRTGSFADAAGSARTPSELPDFIKKILIRRVGAEDLEKVMAGFDAPSPLTCRFNLSRATREETEACLRAQGIEPEPSPLTRNGYALVSAPQVREIEAFNRGFIQIQGVTSILAAEVLAPAPGARVLDICAAPGGKTVALADMVGESGSVTACDLTERKVSRIRENASRCGMPQIRTLVRDAAEFIPEDEDAYDCVMADLPCSGLGTIGHKQEIRYRITPEKVAELAALQREILKNAARYVRPGGRLVYSTCTFTYEENEENREYIINELGLRPLAIGLPGLANKEKAKEGYIQLLPGIDPVSDGFFISLYERPDDHD